MERNHSIQVARKFLPTFAEIQGFSLADSAKLRLGLSLPTLDLTLAEILETGQSPSKDEEILGRWRGVMLHAVMLNEELVGYIRVKQQANGKGEVLEMGDKNSPELEQFRIVAKMMSEGRD